jgi:hypothetical protein
MDKPEPRKPIEILMDGVLWEVLPPQPPGDIPHATHRGVLKIGDYELEVFQLSNGGRVISAESLEALFASMGQREL